MADVLERLKAALADRYRIERELGSGGMATVYLAADVKHHRQLVLPHDIPSLRPIRAENVQDDRSTLGATGGTMTSLSHVLAVALLCLFAVAPLSLSAQGARAATGSMASSPTVDSIPWAERYAMSLHGTGQGLQTYYSAGNNGLELFSQVPYSDLGCKNCHEPSLTGGCASCHTTPDPQVGAHVDAGLAEDQACGKCHSAPGFSDVHSDAGMTCMDCHTLEDVMGDGTSYASMQEAGAIDASCENCHANLASNDYHDTHGDRLSCSTCHMQGLTICYNCHYQTALPEAETEQLAEVTNSMFLVNKNGKVHPATILSLVYQGKRLLSIAPAYSHTIARNAVSGCGDCHGSANVQDLADDSVLVVAEFDGVAGVRIAEGRIPVPFNYETALVFDYLTYDSETESWEFLARGQDVTQFLFAEPLSDEQLEKLRQ
jgi:hypothetical protein